MRKSAAFHCAHSSLPQEGATSAVTFGHGCSSSHHFIGFLRSFASSHHLSFTTSQRTYLDSPGTNISSSRGEETKNERRTRPTTQQCQAKPIVGPAPGAGAGSCLLEPPPTSLHVSFRRQAPLPWRTPEPYILRDRLRRWCCRRRRTRSCLPCSPPGPQTQQINGVSGIAMETTPVLHASQEPVLSMPQALINSQGFPVLPCGPHTPQNNQQF